MNFLQKIGNGLRRFMYGRNGGDQLGLCLLWSAIALDVLTVLLRRAELLCGILSFVSAVLLLVTLFRVFSRDLESRRKENAAFLQKVWWPLKRRLSGKAQQRRDKDHKYFTCPQCHAVCRVPVGKGQIIITCPRCGCEIRGKS